MILLLLFLVNSFNAEQNITSIRYQRAFLIEIQCLWNNNKKTLNPIDLQHEDNLIINVYGRNP